MALRLLALLLAALLPVGFALDPVQGDLTRAGGYTENAFGPKAPQAVFVPPLAEPARAGTRYDVVVIGDGFSHPDPDDARTPFGQFWTDHLRNATGLTVGVMHQERVSAWSYVNSAEFRERPPRVLIVETMERRLRHQLPAMADADTVAETAHVTLASSRPAPEAIPVKPLQATPQPRPRPMAHDGLIPPLGDALQFLSKAAERAMSGPGESGVVELPVTYTRLFTSEKRSSSLFLAEDFASWRADQVLLAERRAAFRRLQQAVESNGVTRFLLMVPPDKGTVYADFLEEPPPVRSIVETTLRDDPQLNLVPLAKGLREMAANGTADLYAPNDSRWGAEGQRFAAQAVHDSLRRMGVIATPESPHIATLPCKPGYLDCAVATTAAE
ncbi:hypothetical protein [Azospirillum sp. SYSU D00513]|uniref:alginate O-acetyltransferase AlgX-related protein n=1 Tax=Azospirillum sp. SYSU D00513 TaxID=2812561 RepID=UPI001A959BB1|nr:hypothetical protein [Azospirillum sp. SYSU D00513]